MDRRRRQMGQILEAVAVHFKSMGYAVFIQPRVISGRYATSLIVGETRDAAAHLHAAECKRWKVNFGTDLQRQFAEHLFISTALLFDSTIPDNPL